MATPIEPEPVQGIENAPGPNPAWSEVLSAIPEEYHSVVTPHFQKWDQAAQSRIEQVNSQFSAYQPFVENNIDAEELERGLRLMYEINTNPADVWKALGEAYNLTPAETAAIASGTNPDPTVITPDPASDPRIDQLQQGIELVSQIVLDDQQKRQAAAEDAAVERELKQLAEKHGDFDQTYVLSLMMNDYTGEQAVQAFHEMKNNLLQSSQPVAPSILGSSGGGSGLPSQAIDPTKLSSNDTKNLVAQMLRAQLGGNT